VTDRPLRIPLPRSTTAPAAVADAGLNPGGTLRDDQADACRTLGDEGVTSGAPAVSPRHGDDGTAANRPLRITWNTRHNTLPRSTAPAAVADAGLKPGGTLRDDRAGGRRTLGEEGVTSNAPVVAAPLLLKVA
jgi:hypothetical protein